MTRRLGKHFKPARAMIPGEILCALFAFTLAVSGAVGKSSLYYIIQAVDNSVYSNIAWGLCLGVPALTNIYVSSREWMYGHSWTISQVADSCKLRGRCVLAQGLAWLYAIKVLFDSLQGNAIPGVKAQTICGLIFCVWAYWENRRVQREKRRVRNVNGFAFHSH